MECCPCWDFLAYETDRQTGTSPVGWRAGVHDVKGMAEGDRFVQSEKQMIKEKFYHCLQIPNGESERKQSQALRETQ